MNIRKITPVLIVERIEPVVPFWLKLGAAATVEVPDGTEPMVVSASSS